MVESFQNDWPVNWSKQNIYFLWNQKTNILMGFFSWNERTKIFSEKFREIDKWLTCLLGCYQIGIPNIESGYVWKNHVWFQEINLLVVILVESNLPYKLHLWEKSGKILIILEVGGISQKHSQYFWREMILYFKGRFILTYLLNNKKHGTKQI